MKGEILSRTDLLILSEIAAVLFVSIFIGAIFWVLRPGSGTTYDKLARLPLDDAPSPTAPDAGAL